MSPQMNDDVKPFKTSDLKLTAYLMTKGMDLICCIPTNDGIRKEFWLADTPRRDELIEDFINGSATVPVRLYEMKRTVAIAELRRPTD